MHNTGDWNHPEAATAGHVAFPVYDPAYEPNLEGGTVVRLLVEPRDDEDLLVCSGGWNHVQYEEAFAGDDSDRPCDCPYCASVNPGRDNRAEWKVCQREAAAFPFRHSDPDSPQYQYRHQSEPYLAVMTIGSTEWVGYRKDNDAPFVCRYQHLTASGKAVYDALQAAYPGRRLVLQTWLDT